MLKYFCSTLESLLTATLLIGLMRGFTDSYGGKRAKPVMSVGVILGILSAAVIAYMKNATRKIDTSLWNLRNFAVSIGALLVFFILRAVHAGLRKGKKDKAAAVIGLISVCFLALLSVGMLLYALPDTFGNPFTILMTEKSVLSTGFLYKLIGIIFGVLAAYLSGRAVRSCNARLSSGTAFGIMTAALLLNAVRQATVCLRVMLTKRMIPISDLLFDISKFSSNHDNLFIFGVVIIAALAPVLLWIRSKRAKEPYNTPAEHRKIRWKWIVARRWAGVCLAVMVFSVFSMTELKVYANRTIELSPVEEAEVRDGAVWIPFERVEDCHLHRFGYVTEGGTQIRFIVIKKPNSSSYGIGLDACDICGETGYYEKDGQVVCKLCDVVMNINTIGFKGGCNPIVINYRIENGNIIVPVESLLEYEKEFK